MTVQIPVPVGLARTIFLLALAWLGALGIVVAFDQLRDKGVAREDLQQYVTRGDLTGYARQSDLSAISSQISEAGSGGVGSGVEGLLALLTLDAAARGRLRADVIKDQFFSAASAGDYDSCISWLSGSGTGEVAGREACGQVAGTADFGP